MNSWFSVKTWEVPKTNWQGTYCTSCTSFPVECRDADDTVKIIKSAKIRIYPDARQRSLLRRWFGVSRKTYNATVEHLKTPKTQANFYTLKKWLVPSLPDYCAEVPRSIRDGAVEDACQAVKSAQRKYQETGKVQEVKYRTRKDKVQTLFIRNDSFKDRPGGVVQASIFPTTLGKVKLAEPLPANPKDSRLILENGRWFLCVPHEVDLSLAARTKPYGAAGIDPGMRTFLSFVGDGVAGKIAEQDFQRIAWLCAH